MNLTVANGYPVTDGPTRTSATPDFDAEVQRYYDEGTTMAGSQAAAFQALFGSLVAYRGLHPHAALDEALRTLDIQVPDTYVYFTDEDHG